MFNGYGISKRHIQPFTRGILRRLATHPVEGLPFTVDVMGEGFVIAIDIADFETPIRQNGSVLRVGSVITQPGDRMPEDLFTILQAMVRWDRPLFQIDYKCPQVPVLKVYDAADAPAPSAGDFGMVLRDCRVDRGEMARFRLECGVDDPSFAEVKATVRRSNPHQIHIQLPGGATTMLAIEADRGCLRIHGFLPFPPDPTDKSYGAPHLWGVYDDTNFEVAISPKSTFIKVWDGEVCCGKIV